MSLKPFAVAAAVSLLFIGGGCATKPKPQGIQPRLIGSVALVNDAQKFVLVDVEAFAAPDEGVALKTFGPDGKESGVLAVSRERKTPFVVADIVQGAPQKGDQVFE